MIVVRANDRRPTALRPNRGNRIEVRVNQTMGMNMLKGSAKESQQKCQTSL
jgi:hypothetical protein